MTGYTEKEIRVSFSKISTPKIFHEVDDHQKYPGDYAPNDTLPLINKEEKIIYVEGNSR